MMDYYIDDVFVVKSTNGSTEKIVAEDSLSSQEPKYACQGCCYNHHSCDELKTSDDIPIVDICYDLNCVFKLKMNDDTHAVMMTDTDGCL